MQCNDEARMGTKEIGGAGYPAILVAVFHMALAGLPWYFLTLCLLSSSNPALSINLVNVVCPESCVNRFSRIPGAVGGARKLGGCMRTSIVSVLPLRAAFGRCGFNCLTGFTAEDGVRDIDVERDTELERGVRVGVVYGSRLLPTLTAGAGVAGSPVKPPNPSFGVRSHKLLSLGVMPPLPLVWAVPLFCIIGVVECIELDPRRMKSVRWAYAGS
jgi:hypothetical protein